MIPKNTQVGRWTFSQTVPSSWPKCFFPKLSSSSTLSLWWPVLLSLRSEPLGALTNSILLLWRKASLWVRNSLSGSGLIWVPKSPLDVCWCSHLEVPSASSEHITGTQITVTKCRLPKPVGLCLSENTSTLPAFQEDCFMAVGQGF